MVPYEVRRRPIAQTPRAQVWRTRIVPEEIVQLIERWAEQYGSPPTALDWDPARARRLGHGWRAQRFDAGDWPTARIVRGAFGAFNAAVEQAGLVPRPAPVRISANLAGSESIV